MGAVASEAMMLGRHRLVFELLIPGSVGRFALANPAMLFSIGNPHVVMNYAVSVVLNIR